MRRRVGETLEMAGLSAMARRRPRELSGGQQQRVALCRALVYRPPVILMDEPLGALDKKLRDQLQTEIKRIQQELGLTVIYVTHDQEEALVLSDRIAVMRDGRIDQFDTPRELFERPRTPFVADFLGAANFLPGRVEEQHGERTRSYGSTPAACSRPARRPPPSANRYARRSSPAGSSCVRRRGLLHRDRRDGHLRRHPRPRHRPPRRRHGHRLVRLELPAGRAPALGERVDLAADPVNVSVFADVEREG